MIEDPLERREREAREKKGNPLKITMYALIAVAVLLAGALAYIWTSKASLVRDLNEE